MDPQSDRRIHSPTSRYFSTLSDTGSFLFIKEDMKKVFLGHEVLHLGLHVRRLFLHVGDVGVIQTTRRCIPFEEHMVIA